MNSENDKRNEEIRKQKELYGIQPIRKEIKQAIAVAYTPGERAPKILATGKGELAEKIIQKLFSLIPIFSLFLSKINFQVRSEPATTTKA